MGGRLSHVAGMTVAHFVGLAFILTLTQGSARLLASLHPGLRSDARIRGLKTIVEILYKNFGLPSLRYVLTAHSSCPT